MPNFTQIAAPILKLLQGKNDGKEKITWLKEHEDALNELKSRITSKPILQIFDPDRETFLQTDASSHAIGAVLSQRDPADGQIKPVSYFSEKLSPRKKTLSSYDLELIALERSLKFYRKYLFLKKFKVFTDHKNLVYGRITEAATLNTSRLARITDVLNTFDFEIEHVKGTNNAVADMLSRQINHDKINAIKKIEEDRKNNKFIQNQEQDTEIGALKNILLNKRLDEKIYPRKEIIRLVRNSRRYCLDENEVVCYKKYNRRNLLKLPVIPASLRNEIIHDVHNSAAKGCHSGIARTYAKLATFITGQTCI